MLNELYKYTGCGLDNVYLANGFERVETTRGPGIKIEDVEGLHNLIASELVLKEGILLPSEFRYLRTYMVMSQEFFGAILGNSGQTVARWEKGKTRLPKAADYAIRTLVDAELHKGVSEVRKIIDHINHLEEREMMQLSASHTEDGWKLAA